MFSSDRGQAATRGQHRFRTFLSSPPRSLLNSKETAAQGQNLCWLQTSANYDLGPWIESACKEILNHKGKSQGIDHVHLSCRETHTCFLLNGQVICMAPSQIFIDEHLCCAEASQVCTHHSYTEYRLTVSKVHFSFLLFPLQHLCPLLQLATYILWGKLLQKLGETCRVQTAKGLQGEPAIYKSSVGPNSVTKSWLNYMALNIFAITFCFIPGEKKYTHAHTLLHSKLSDGCN